MNKSGSGRDDDTCFRVTAFAPTFEPGYRGGGPIRSMAEILDTAPEAVRIDLITRNRDHGCKEPYPGLSGRWIERGNSRIFYLSTNNPKHWFRCILKARRARPDLLYLNSLWSPHFSLTPVLLRSLRLLPAERLLLAPRGELSPGALSLKSFKKRAFLKVWKHLLESLNVSFHATSELEASEIRQVFSNSPILVASNEIEAKEVLTGTPRTTGPTKFVFISRITPKKNLLLALEALSLVQSEVIFDIFGPIEDTAYWGDCEASMQRLPDSVHVSYRGELQPDQVRQAFRGYDAFVFPTKGENFGHVIAESLASSCPVICADTTPWSAVLRHGGGSVVSMPTAVEWARHMARWVDLSAQERGRRKTEAAQSYLDWSSNQARANILAIARHASLH